MGEERDRAEANIVDGDESVLQPDKKEKEKQGGRRLGERRRMTTKTTTPAGKGGILRPPAALPVMKMSA